MGHYDDFYGLTTVEQNKQAIQGIATDSGVAHALQQYLESYKAEDVVAGANAISYILLGFVELPEWAKKAILEMGARIALGTGVSVHEVNGIWNHAIGKRLAESPRRFLGLEK